MKIYNRAGRFQPTESPCVNRVRASRAVNLIAPIYKGMKVTDHVFKHGYANPNADWSERWAAGRPFSPCETELPSAPELGGRGVPDALPKVCATGEDGHCLRRGRAVRRLNELTSHACCVCPRAAGSCFSSGAATRHPVRHSGRAARVNARPPSPGWATAECNARLRPFAGWRVSPSFS